MAAMALSCLRSTATDLPRQLFQDLDTLAVVAVVLHVFRVCKLVALLISNGYKTVILPRCFRLVVLQLHRKSLRDEILY